MGKSIAENEYYLVVGRFVPESNYLKHDKGVYMASHSKDFVHGINVRSFSFNQLHSK